MIKNNFAAMNVKIPPSSKRSLSKKTTYSAKILAKYASELERSILLLIESTDLSKNFNLQNQVLQDVLRRFGNKVGSNESVDVRHTMISNMKRLVDDMREFGTNDIKQIKYLKRAWLLQYLAASLCKDDDSYWPLEENSRIWERIKKKVNS